MIFVTLGTQKQSFDRLIEYLRHCKGSIVVQNGYTKCNYKHFNFLDYNKMQEYMKKSDYIISHGGICIMEALKLNKKIIVVPREKRYKEHVNNHQFEICDYLEKNGYILVAKTEAEFIEKVKEIKNFQPKKYFENSNMFYSKFDNLLKNILD